MIKSDYIKKIVLIYVLFIFTHLTAQTNFVVWDFEGDHLTPAIGAGSLNFTGNIIYEFQNGLLDNGVLGRAVNTSQYPPQGMDNETSGLQCNVSTDTYSNISINWNTRFSNTAANRIRVQYTIDGMNWINFYADNSNATNLNLSTNIPVPFEEGLFITDAGTVWYSRSLNFSGIPEVNNNPLFSVRFVTAFYSVIGGYSASSNLTMYSTSGTIRYDNIAFSYGATNGVSAPTAFPNPGQYTSPFTVSLSCATNGAQIRYTVDGSDPNESSPLYISPFTISQTTLVKAKAFLTGETSSNTTSLQYTFPLPISDLLGLRNLNPDGVTLYKITGEVFLTYQQAFRNQKYVQDSQAGLLIDDLNGIITEQYRINDGITGLTGKISMYNNMLQFIPFENPGPAHSVNNNPLVSLVSLSELINNYNSYESRLVKISDVYFTTVPDTFQVGMVYGISDGSTNFNFRTTFYDADYINFTLPQGRIEITGIINERLEGVYITSRYANEFTANNNQIQDIDFISGWNLCSFRIVPGDSDISSIFNPLIISNSLYKVQNEQGSSFEYLNYINSWVNNIGIMSITEGYYVKVNTNCQLNISGVEASLPLTVPLLAGWNIIGYPYNQAQSVPSVLQAVINNNTLIKVMDESGHAFEYLPDFGWINNIGNFQPGKGYVIKVSSTTNLVYSSQSSFQSKSIINQKKRINQHFKPIWTNNGFQHFNLYIRINSDQVSNLREGDVFGLYCNNFCVGYGTYSAESGIVSIISSKDDPTTNEVDGYIEGTEYTLKYWSSSKENIDTSLQVIHVSGSDHYEAGGSSVITVILPLQNEENIINEPLLNLTISPSPFKAETQIKFNQKSEGKVTIKIFNIKGQLIKTYEERNAKIGQQRIVWDGRDKNHQRVSSGLYFVKVSSTGIETLRKVIFIK